MLIDWHQKKISAMFNTNPPNPWDGSGMPGSMYAEDPTRWDERRRLALEHLSAITWHLNAITDEKGASDGIAP